MSSSSEAEPDFSQLGLSKPLLTALNDIGYETPSPIQAKTIPLVQAGRDVIGQAQTGTGKTAAFALPLLSKINLESAVPQVLVLTPTRELAIQVSEAFQKYARYLKGFHVTPIYGGQSYGGQIQALKRGVHVVVGTPGRVMDHMRKGTLKLNKLSTLVLDEADEMLRMGFIDDVEWVLEQSPEHRQIALFSATMPSQIKKIATRHLNDPEHILIEVKTTTADTIRQRYWPVRGVHKLDALTRILEAESFDAILIFVRTKMSTIDLAEKLSARGFAAVALNGDIAQAQRERTVRSLKSGKIDVIVATDVAARGLDVERISHVINYDIPTDTESYVHRVGRTGRAGRSGEAISFVAPRENRLLYAIEKATRQKIEKMELPSTKLINEQRITRFTQRISDSIEKNNLNRYVEIIKEYQTDSELELIDIAAALAKLAQGNAPLLVEAKHSHEPKGSARKDSKHQREHAEHNGHKRPSTPRKKKLAAENRVEEGMVRYRVEVGTEHGTNANNLVGAIANEAEIDSQYIGKIQLFEKHSFIDLPEGMPKQTFKHLKNTWVSQRKLNITVHNKKTGANDTKKNRTKGQEKKRTKNNKKPKRKPRPRNKKTASGNSD